MAHLKIAKNQIKNALTGEMIPVEKLWENKTCVISFMRRFGCTYCRTLARELSALKPILDENNISLVGIGLEELGLEDYLKGEFFKGELFVDDDKKCFRDLEFRRYNMFNIWGAIFDKDGRDRIRKGREEGVGGNLKGDGLQMGGLMVVTAGGNELKVLHKQEHPAKDIDPAEVLNVLGLKDQYKPNDSPKEPPKCDDTACYT